MDPCRPKILRRMKGATKDVEETETIIDQVIIGLMRNEDPPDPCTVPSLDKQSGMNMTKILHPSIPELTKSPFLGFDQIHSDRISDWVEKESGNLLSRIQNIELIISIAAAITSVNQGGPVNISKRLLPQEQAHGTYITLKIIKVPGQRKTIQQMMADLCKPLRLGWRRELLYTKASCSKAEMVQYVAPDGTELKTMEEIEECLNSTYQGGLTIDNFSFQKSPVSKVKTGKAELIFFVDAKTGGKVLVHPPGLNSVGEGITKKQNLSTPPRPIISANKFQHKSDKPLLPFPSQSWRNHKSQALLPMEWQSPRAKHPRNYNTSPQNSGAFLDMDLDTDEFSLSLNYENPLDPETVVISETCSVRCEGNVGCTPAIPCKNCLCLFHNTCVGFPEDMEPEAAGDFICVNCLTAVRFASLSSRKARARGPTLSSRSPVSSSSYSRSSTSRTWRQQETVPSMSPTMASGIRCSMPSSNLSAFQRSSLSTPPSVSVSVTSQWEYPPQSPYFPRRHATGTGGTNLDFTSKRTNDHDHSNNFASGSDYPNRSSLPQRMPMMMKRKQAHHQTSPSLLVPPNFTVTKVRRMTP